MSLDFFVRGTPAPGGSKKVVFIRDRTGHIVYRNGWPLHKIVDDGAHNAAWKLDVERAARANHQGEPFSGPLRMVAEFLIQRPKWHHIGGKRSRPLRADAPTDHLQKPDCSKFLRSTEDAMTGVVYFDDHQVVQHSTGKRWADPGEKPGARIKITAPIYPTRKGAA